MHMRPPEIIGTNGLADISRLTAWAITADPMKVDCIVYALKVPLM